MRIRTRGVCTYRAIRLTTFVRENADFVETTTVLRPRPQRRNDSKKRVPGQTYKSYSVIFRGNIHAQQSDRQHRYAP